MIMDMGVAQLAKTTNENFMSMMWVFQGNNVCSLIIMDANVAWLEKKKLRVII